MITYSIIKAVKRKKCFMEMNKYNIKSALKDLFDFESIEVIQNPLDVIQLEMIKDAFRKKAKNFHPDRAAVLGINESLLNEKFKRLNDSYQFLISIIKDNKKIVVNYNTKKSEGYPDKSQKSSGSKFERDDFFYEGLIPKRKLRFAEFLYFKKIISWNNLIKSIVFQYQMRPRIGEIGVINNFLTNDEVSEILKNIKLNENFGKVAIRLGKLNDYQLSLILSKQKKLNLPIGKYFIDKKILTMIQLQKYLLEKQEFNLSF